MIKLHGLKYHICLVVMLVIVGIVFFLVRYIQYENIDVSSPINIGSYPTTIEIVEGSVYSHGIAYCSDRHKMVYTLTNSSEYWYVFEQIQQAFKLIDYEWFRIMSYVDVLGLSDYISPNGSINRSFNLSAFGNLRDITLPLGVYLFKKPLNQIICLESWDIDRYKTIWVHLILEVE